MYILPHKSLSYSAPRSASKAKTTMTSTTMNWVEVQEESAVRTPLLLRSAKSATGTELPKRFFDLAVAIILLPIVLPVMFLVALAVKLDSEGPVFFGQTRIGRYGKPFTCLKFRSMCVNAEAIKAQLAAQNEATGPVFKMKNDPRITRVGRIIRKLSLDELPQFFNILTGEMSFVGPRPAVPNEVKQYTEQQMERLDAVPGLTGLQQVMGRSNLDFEQWIAYDLEYIQNRSVLFDLRILLMTVPAVITAKGAY